MRILLIKLKHIGDSLLLTAATRAIREEYPQAEISVLVRKGCEGILAGAESIDHVHTSVAPEAANRGWSSQFSELVTILQLRCQRYDFILELTRGDRGRWWTAALRGRTKTTYEMRSGKRFWNLFFDELVPAPSPFIHAVEQDFALVQETLRLPDKQPVALEFRLDRVEPVTETHSGTVLIHPATRWKRKQWPEESWRELIHLLVQRGENVILSSGPDQAEMNLCQSLVKHFDETQVTFTGGQLSWTQLAGLLYGAKAFIGVDTAAMHLAAACNTPTVGLFLPWIAPMWHPWQVSHAVVYADGFPTRASAELNDLATAVSAMQAITPQQVATALEELIA